MKWSTIVALIAVGVVSLVVVTVVQLWRLAPEESDAAGDVANYNSPTNSPAIEHDNEDSFSTLEGGNTDVQQHSTFKPVDAEAENDQPQSADEEVSGSESGALVKVTGDVGNITFTREYPPEDVTARIRKTEVSVVGENGEELSFTSDNGQPVVVTQAFEDGLYKWQAVHQPQLDPRVREELTAARRAGDFQAQRELERKFKAQGLLPTEEEISANVQSGTFRIVNGQLVNRNVAER